MNLICILAEVNFRRARGRCESVPSMMRDRARPCTYFDGITSFIGGKEVCLNFFVTDTAVRTCMIDV